MKPSNLAVMDKSIRAYLALCAIGTVYFAIAGMGGSKSGVVLACAFAYTAGRIKSAAQAKEK